MQALILGCGEAFDTDFFNTSILVRTGVSTILLDCGYSIPARLWQAEPDANAIDVIYVSHAHADHFFGLPAVLGRMWEDGRTKPLTILTQTPVIDDIRAAMDLGYRSLATKFEYAIDFRSAKLDQTFDAGGASFRFAETRHSVSNFAVSIEIGGKTLCYSGDGMFTKVSRELFADADLLIHEAYSFESSPIHADINAVIEMADAGSVKQVALVHVQRDVRRRPERLSEVMKTVQNTRVMLPEPGASIGV
jgi:ribonuclease Z